MPKITVHGGPSNAYDTRPVQERRYDEPENASEKAQDGRKPPTGTNYSTWSYKELLAELRQRELPRQGTAAELAERLKENDSAKARGETEPDHSVVVVEVD